MLGHHITPDEEFWEGFLFDGERANTVKWSSQLPSGNKEGTK